VTVADLVLIGLAITLEPIPLTGFIVLLAGRRGALNGLGYILGWMACLIVVVAATVFLTGGHAPRPSTGPSVAASAVRAALGLALVGFAWYRRRHPRPATGAPKWASRLDAMSPWAAAVVAAVLQPWVLVGAGADVVVGMNVSTAGSVLLLAGFCLLATAAPIVLELSVVLAPEAAARRHERLRHAIDAHRAGAIVVIAAVVGLWLLSTGLSAIVSA
jgi:Sap-like sulfolipid-1-addressing protein